jgi:type II secretory ATPase GspE/PulE/Tfp pilus assembly ATPase PilB-like protein
MNPTLTRLKRELSLGTNTQEICTLIIMCATEYGSSDIHIEPGASVVRVRYRIDGVLQTIIEYGGMLHAQIVARHKILGNLKLDESRKPQDGRISLHE